MGRMTRERDGYLGLVHQDRFPPDDSHSSGELGTVGHAGSA